MTGEEVIGWCRERLAHFKCPKSVEFTASFPRTTTGKVLKRELRAQLAAQDTAGQDTAGQDTAGQGKTGEPHS